MIQSKIKTGGVTATPFLRPITSILQHLARGRQKGLRMCNELHGRAW
jgi:hypothetical protein